MNKTNRLAAVNSINWARILAQISYYFFAYVQLCNSAKIKPYKDRVRFVVPTGNFGDVLAGYFAKRMGLPVEKLVVATNANDILHRFWRTGRYEKKATHGKEAEGGFAEDGAKAHEGGVRETLSPAMDILVSSNFERLLWYLAYRLCKSEDSSQWSDSSRGGEPEKRIAAGRRVKEWQQQLKTSGGFAVDKSILDAAREDFQSERVDDEETVAMIRQAYRTYSSSSSFSLADGGVGPGSPDEVSTKSNYVLDPHSAIGIAASLRCIKRMSREQQEKIAHVSLATAHPAKFSKAVEMALSGEDGFSFEREVLPEQFRGLETLPRRVERLKRPVEMATVRALMRGLMGSPC